jgi:DNA invertase Pin-like site-specific DNA recombinase
MPRNKVSTPVQARAAIYARAHDPQSDSKIDAQHALCRRYCEFMGYDPILYAHDCDGSGRPLSESDGWQSVLHAAHRHKISVVVCADLDRVARDPINLLRALEELRRADVVLETPHAAPASFGVLERPKGLNRRAHRSRRSNSSQH